MTVQFQDYAEERVSEEFGPFEWVQITGRLIRGCTPDDDRVVAEMRDGTWLTTDGSTYSDVMVYAKGEEK